MDEMDFAQAVGERWLEDCLAEHRRHNLSSHASLLTVCIDCGEEIPEKRRRAVPGCRRCIDCQTLFERRHR